LAAFSRPIVCHRLSFSGDHRGRLRVTISVGEDDDADALSCGERLHDHARTAEHFIVRMRREHENVARFAQVTFSRHGRAVKQRRASNQMCPAYAAESAPLLIQVEFPAGARRIRTI
jgi:hypothetical protein